MEIMESYLKKLRFGHEDERRYLLNTHIPSYRKFGLKINVNT